MTTTAGYTGKIWLIAPSGIISNRSTTTTSAPPEPGHAS
jgi:hypothetical protein